MTSYCACKKPTGDPGENCSVCGFMVPNPGIASEKMPPAGVMRVPPEEIQVEKTNKTITLYICPTPGCPSVTAVTDPSEKLEESWTGPKVEDRAALEAGTHGSRYRHNRAECPLCRIKGDPVQRIRMTTTLAVPVIGPPTPPLPGPTGKHHPVAVRKPEG